MASTNVDQPALWQRWQTENDQSAYDELLSSLDPLIRSRVSQWNTNPINPVALRGHAYSLVRDALPAWDSTKGSLTTHVVNSLMPLSRYVNTYQNPSYVPERVANEFGNIKSVEAELMDELDRRPTVYEIATRAKMKPDKVERILGGMATSVPISAVLDEADQQREILDAMQSMDNRDMYLFRAELEGQERKIFDFILTEAKRRGGTVPPRDIAEAFGIPVEDVYQYKNAWTRRLKNVGI